MRGHERFEGWYDGFTEVCPGLLELRLTQTRCILLTLKVVVDCDIIRIRLSPHTFNISPVFPQVWHVHAFLCH